MTVGDHRHAPAALPPGKTRYPLCRRLGGPKDRFGRVRKISPPPAFDPRTVQSVALPGPARPGPARPTVTYWPHFISDRSPTLQAACCKNRTERKTVYFYVRTVCNAAERINTLYKTMTRERGSLFLTWSTVEPRAYSL